ncbi:hypothetical protein [uncultured Rhodoblastus sp.]|uniref:hypothetical protein n=1 Tax=uncultured Rhodoblastus sp. TaxID=543037 RepID=UPI0025E9D2ED|nr:hypothetical protein [uncultured Rhodoblastus sp.]
MEHLLLAAATRTQDDAVNAASNVGLYVSERVTATIFGANNTINSIIGADGSNNSITVGANDGVRLDGGSSDSRPPGAGSFVSSADAGVTLSHFNPYPAGIADLLDGSGDYLSASAFGPLTSDVAGALQRVLGGGNATDIAGSVWDFG